VKQGREGQTVLVVVPSLYSSNRPAQTHGAVLLTSPGKPKKIVFIGRYVPFCNIVVRGRGRGKLDENLLAE
jgi:hypothetical protein